MITIVHLPLSPPPLGETTSHSTRLQETAAKSLVIPSRERGFGARLSAYVPSPLAGEGQGEGYLSNNGVPT